MKYTYQSPIGNLLIESSNLGISRITITSEFHHEIDDNISETVKWLDLYFNNEVPNFTPSLDLNSASNFQKEVYSELLKIKYGEVTTYGEIAKIIAIKRGINKMSARAVGHALHNNPIIIILGCHRVLNVKDLGGYAYGSNIKKYLIDIEKNA